MFSWWFSNIFNDNDRNDCVLFVLFFSWSIIAQEHCSIISTDTTDSLLIVTIIFWCNIHDKREQYQRINARPLCIDCAKSTHPYSIFRVVVVRIKKLCILGWSNCPQKRVWPDCANVRMYTILFFFLTGRSLIMHLPWMHSLFKSVFWVKWLKLISHL